MTLITTGKAFIRDLEQSGALGVYVPLEGGHEGRYQRRLRATGYEMLHITARGLGDPASYLLNVHGVRPPHLGKKTTGQDAAVGATYYIPPMASYPLSQLPSSSKGLVIWLLEGMILSRQELEFFATLPQTDSRLKVVIELGGDRSFQWRPLQTILRAAS